MTNLTNEKMEELKKDFDRWYKEKNEEDKINKNLDINKMTEEEKKELVSKIDKKMIEYALEEKGPILLGGLTFHYDEKCKWYEALKQINGTEVSIHSYGLNNLEKVLGLAVKYYKELDLSNLKEYIADDSYEQDKVTWQFENITKQEFINNLTLVAIEVDETRVEYWFDDNDMYAGHSITVRKKHDDDKMEVNLEG